MARAHGLAALRDDDGLRHFAQRIGCGIGGKTAIVFDPRDRRVGKQFEIVVRHAALLVDDGGSLGLNADADA